MALITSGRTRAVWVLLGLCLLGMLTQGALWWRDVQRNQLIASGVPSSVPTTHPHLLFAQASALAASSADEAALQRLGVLQSDPDLSPAARYNSANILLRQATTLRDGAQPGQALALVELAKESYRQVLRQDPQHWHARYNLERAQRLVPDPDDMDTDAPAAPEAAERAATTMRGYSPGLP
jgi:mxaK protein